MVRRRRNKYDPPKRGKRRLVTFLLSLIVIALVGGFIAFAEHVDNLSIPDNAPSADGIVVWTGKGGGRLETGGRLLRNGRGERLLISGVNENVSLSEVARLSGLSRATSECCVDIDYAALDTRGNARETASWARALGYDHILLVTSAYHMPRAQLEIAHEAGRIRITPIAVEAEDDAKWWNDSARFRRLAGEYGKYLMSLARGRFTKSDEDSSLVLPPLETDND